ERVLAVLEVYAGVVLVTASGTRQIQCDKLKIRHAIQAAACKVPVRVAIRVERVLVDVGVDVNAQRTGDRADVEASAHHLAISGGKDAATRGQYLCDARLKAGGLENLSGHTA